MVRTSTSLSVLRALVALAGQSNTTINLRMSLELHTHDSFDATIGVSLPFREDHVVISTECLSQDISWIDPRCSARFECLRTTEDQFAFLLQLILPKPFPLLLPTKYCRSCSRRSLNFVRDLHRCCAPWPVVCNYPIDVRNLIHRLDSNSPSSARPAVINTRRYASLTDRPEFEQVSLVRCGDCFYTREAAIKNDISPKDRRREWSNSATLWGSNKSNRVPSQMREHTITVWEE